MIDDRLQRGADAACTALIAITANKMPKTVHFHSNLIGHRKFIPPLAFHSNDNSLILGLSGRYNGTGSTSVQTVSHYYHLPCLRYSLSRSE